MPLSKPPPVLPEPGTTPKVKTGSGLAASVYASPGPSTSSASSSSTADDTKPTQSDILRQKDLLRIKHLVQEKELILNDLQRKLNRLETIRSYKQRTMDEQWMRWAGTRDAYDKRLVAEQMDYIQQCDRTERLALSPATNEEEVEEEVDDGSSSVYDEDEDDVEDQNQEVQVRRARDVKYQDGISAQQPVQHSSLPSRHRSQKATVRFSDQPVSRQFTSDRPVSYSAAATPPSNPEPILRNTSRVQPTHSVRFDDGILPNGEPVGSVTRPVRESVGSVTKSGQGIGYLGEEKVKKDSLTGCVEDARGEGVENQNVMHRGRPNVEHRRKRAASDAML